jgi:hypothetical protein
MRLQARATLLPKTAAGAENPAICGTSGGRQREPDMNRRLRLGRCLAVRASGAAGLGAGAERLIDDGLDGARASAALGAAAEASIDLLGIAGKVLGGADGAANIVVAEDVAGTNDHKNGEPIGDAEPTDI